MRASLVAMLTLAAILLASTATAGPTIERSRCVGTLVSSGCASVYATADASSGADVVLGAPCGLVPARGDCFVGAGAGPGGVYSWTHPHVLCLVVCFHDG